LNLDALLFGPQSFLTKSVSLGDTNQMASLGDTNQMLFFWTSIIPHKAKKVGNKETEQVARVLESVHLNKRKWTKMYCTASGSMLHLQLSIFSFPLLNAPLPT